MIKFREEYTKRIVPGLVKKFGYKNRLQAPKLEKVVINVGAGEAVADPKFLEVVSEDLGTIAGQKPVITRAKRAISAFRIRKGMPIGCKVTLRGDRMFEFLERFLNFAAPRIRDFRGFSEDSFDGRGGYSFGLSEQVIFPEIDVNKIKKVFGMDITIVTSARYDDEAKALLQEFGMPFRKKGSV